MPLQHSATGQGHRHYSNDRGIDPRLLRKSSRRTRTNAQIPSSLASHLNSSKMMHQSHLNWNPRISNVSHVSSTKNYSGHGDGLAEAITVKSTGRRQSVTSTSNNSRRRSSRIMLVSSEKNAPKSSLQQFPSDSSPKQSEASLPSTSSSLSLSSFSSHEGEMTELPKPLVKSESKTSASGKRKSSLSSARRNSQQRRKSSRSRSSSKKSARRKRSSASSLVTSFHFPRTEWYTNVESIQQIVHDHDSSSSNEPPHYRIELTEEPFPNTYFSFIVGGGGTPTGENSHRIECHDIEAVLVEKRKRRSKSATSRGTSSNKPSNFFHLEISPIDNQNGLYKHYGIFYTKITSNRDEPFSVTSSNPEDYRYLDASIKYNDDILHVTSHEPLQEGEYYHFVFSIPYYEETWYRDLRQFGTYRFLHRTLHEGDAISLGGSSSDTDSDPEEIPLRDNQASFHPPTLSSQEHLTRLNSSPPSNGTLRQHYSTLIGHSFQDREMRVFSLGEGSETVLVSARVHPGETCGSIIMRGLLRLLSHETDPRAQMLRSQFKFVFLPFVNPDGVYTSRYRTNPNGENLNRCYKETDPDDHPEIASIKNYIAYAVENENLKYYIDLHAHAKTRGCFIYGNHMHEQHHVNNVLFARLMALNSQHFTFSGCNFSKKGMQRDKSNTGRVTMYHEHSTEDDPLFCYTLEINYSTGVSLNKMAPLQIPPNATLKGMKLHIPKSLNRGPSSACAPIEKWDRYLCKQPAGDDASHIPRFTSVHHEDIGFAIGISLLDLIGKNPFSRVAESRFKTLDGVRIHIQQHLSLKATRRKRKIKH